MQSPRRCPPCGRARSRTASFFASKKAPPRRCSSTVFQSPARGLSRSTKAAVLSSMRCWTRRRRERVLSPSLLAGAAALRGLSSRCLLTEPPRSASRGAPRLNISDDGRSRTRYSCAPLHHRPRVQRRALAPERWSWLLCFVCCVRAVRAALTKMKERRHV